MKKHKKDKREKEKKKSDTCSSEDLTKEKDNSKKHHRHKKTSKHEHVHSLLGEHQKKAAREREASPKKEDSKKLDAERKHASFTGKAEQSRDRGQKHSSKRHHASSTEKRTSSSVSKDSVVQTKFHVEKRLSPEQPRQSVSADLLCEERRKVAKRSRSSPDEEGPVTKRRNAEKMRDGGKSKIEELSQKLKERVKRRGIDSGHDVDAGRTTKRVSDPSKPFKSPALTFVTKSTKDIRPERSSDDRQEKPDSGVSGEKLLTRPRLRVAFKIPKKPTATLQTGMSMWDKDKGNKMPDTVNKHASAVCTSAKLSPKHNKPRPEQVPSQAPVCTSPQKASSLTEVKPKTLSPLKETCSTNTTPVWAEHAVGQDVSPEHEETYDNDHEMQLVEELHQARTDRRLQVNVVESYGELTCMDVDPPEEASTSALSQQEREQDTFIVLDTNVLLSHLDFLKKILSHGLGALGFPTLLVPWVVLQELDALKNGKLSTEVGSKAVPAVHFIYSCLKGQESRLWGQSMQQASQAACGLNVENNDDRVLQCCLQYQKLYPEGNIILCTNDKNLCSKALLSGVKALSKADLVQHAEPGLLNHTFSRPTARLPDETSKEERRRPCEEEDRMRKSNDEGSRRDLSECVCVLESSLQRALSAVLEEEMKAAFGELWTEVVYLPPPWTLDSVLQCFRKHWIAVFGVIIRRSLLSCVEKLSHSLCSGVSVDGASLLTAVYVAEELLTALNQRSSYGGHVSAALSCLKSLQHRLQPQAPKLPVENTSDLDALMSEAGEDDALPAQVSHQEVWALFESIWTNVCHISSALFSALHYSPDSSEIVAPRPSPPPQDALACLYRLCAALQQLLEAFQRVLSVDGTVEDSQALLDFIRTSEIAAMLPSFTAKNLFDCLSQQEYREKLCVGGSQLMELRTKLDHCAASVCGQGGGQT